MPSTSYHLDIQQEKAVRTENVSMKYQLVQTVYEKEFLNAKIENMILRNKLKLEEENKNEGRNVTAASTSLSISSIISNDAKMKLFTLLYYYQFLALFEFLGGSVYNLTCWDCENTKENTKKGIRKLEPQEELFLTLVCLRRGYSLDTMSHFFGLAASTWIQLLYCHFNTFRQIMFPVRQHFKAKLPRVFRTFKNIRCISDCTECFVQMPRDCRCQGNLYSSYKNHRTYKSLIEVAPNGAIVFVSELFQGLLSDRAIVEQSGFLDYINHGDLILADRGFTIENLLITRQALLNSPPFLGKVEYSFVPFAYD